mmetsp:Transcript_11578/g.30968  ORF Transcript_11578/g.30968 Transcript_11578/m.30968 type:complete len:217 (-) Transcript_11578:599-1249(-)
MPGQGGLAHVRVDHPLKTLSAFRPVPCKAVSKTAMSMIELTVRKRLLALEETYGRVACTVRSPHDSRAVMLWLMGGTVLKDLAGEAPIYLSNVASLSTAASAHVSYSETKLTEVTVRNLDPSRRSGSEMFSGAARSGCPDRMRLNPRICQMATNTIDTVTTTKAGTVVECRNVACMPSACSSSSIAMQLTSTTQKSRNAQTKSPPNVMPFTAPIKT